MAGSLSLYNHNTQSDDDFIANFVARHEVLETLLRRLRGYNADSGDIHNILVGPRGMGKTSLLRRFAIAISRDEELAARYVPLGFREEQYNVLTGGDFWRNCGEALAEWAETAGRNDLAERLDEALASDAWATSEGAAEQFAQEMAQLGRRAVLLVDNVDMILEALPDADQWSLRRRLQAKQGPVMIGTVTHLLKQSADSQAAFYEFFQPHHLDALGERETEQCLRSLAEQRGENGRPVLQVLNSQPERLKTLHNLTGGNPRILALVYRLLEAAESEAAMDDLNILLDQITPYYKARIEEYQTAQQRAVIDALALNWDPITTGSLSRATKIPSTTLSPLLNRLRKDGLIELTDTSGSYSGHQLVERFLNIWYLMRHGTRRTKQKMRWLVEFLTGFYSSSDLEEISRRAKSRSFCDAWHKDYEFAFNEALARKNSEPTVGAGSHYSSSNFSAEPKERLVGDEQGLGAMAAVVQEADALLSALGDLWAKGDFGQYIAVLDEFIQRCESAEELEFRELTAKAMVNKGVALARMKQSVAEIAVYDMVATRFGRSPELSLRHQVARALLYKGVTLGEMNDSVSEIATYDQMLSLFGEAEEPILRELVAKALINKGYVLGSMGDNEAAIAAYDLVILRFDKAPAPNLREQVARALINKGVRLRQMGEHVAAIAAYDVLLDRLRDAEEPILHRMAAAALINKGLLFDLTRDPAAEIAVYDLLLSRFGDSKDVGVLEQVAKAMVNKAVTLGQIGDHVGEMTAYDAVLHRFGEIADAPLREQVSKALVNKGIRAGKSGDWDEAISLYDAVAARFDASDGSAVREQVARALVNKAVALSRAGDKAAAISTYDSMLSRFADDDDAMVRVQVAKALNNKGVTLGEMNDSAAEIAIYDLVLDRFSDARELPLREQAARALLYKAVTLGQTGDSAAAVAAYDLFISSFGDAEGPVLREFLAEALINKGVRLGQMGESEAEVAVYDMVVARFDSAKEQDLRDQVATAVFFKGITLGQLGEDAAEMAAYEQALERLPEAPQARTAEVSAAIRIRLGNALFSRGGDITRIENLYRQAASVKPLTANGNLAWLYLMSDRLADALSIRALLGDLPANGLALLDAGLELLQDNFGSSSQQLATALEGRLDHGDMDFSDDLERLLRLAEQRGYAERLLTWFEETNFADRVAPIYVAFKAYVRGEDTLLDINPEVRQPARVIYDRLDTSRRMRSAQGKPAPKTRKPGRLRKG